MNFEKQLSIEEDGKKVGVEEEDTQRSKIVSEVQVDDDDMPPPDIDDFVEVKKEKNQRRRKFLKKVTLMEMEKNQKLLRYLKILLIEQI